VPVCNLPVALRHMTYKKNLLACAQWVVIPILVVGLIAWCLSPAYPQVNLAKPNVPLPVTKHTAPNATTSSSADIQEIKDRLKEMESQERQNYVLVLEGQRKTMDWWFSFLAVLTAVLAIFGALIPFLMARKDKELIKQDKEQIKQDMEQIKQDMEQIKHMLVDAGVFVGQIQQHQVVASRTVEQTKQLFHEIEDEFAKFPNGDKENLAEAKEAKEAVAPVQQGPTPDSSRELRAAAIAASEAKQSEKAYMLWRALTELNPTDSNALFNAGYWAQDVAETLKADDAVRWFRQAEQHYESTHKLDPGHVNTLFNWGIVLASEARALAASDLATARLLWRQAGEKYAQALNIMPDAHDAAINWGNDLAEEAENIAASDLTGARALWRQAGEKYAQALQTTMPDKHEAAYYWGLVLAAEASALASSDLTAARALWRQAGEKYAQALRIKSDNYEAAYNWGGALAAEASASLAARDLTAARALWRQAGEKYEQALRIMPDYYPAVSNWGNMFALEARSIAASDLTVARALWRQAGEKYEQAFRIKPDRHVTAYNWGLALGAEASALAANDLTAARALWRQAGEKYEQALRIKPDYHKAANNLGSVLLSQVGTFSSTEGDQINPLLDRAEEVLLEHTAAAPGRVAFNLACVYGRRGDVSNCLRWLRVSNGYSALPNCEVLRTDRDLDAVRTSPEFMTWLHSVCPQ